jgi:hypothetical protein
MAGERWRGEAVTERGSNGAGYGDVADEAMDGLRGAAYHDHPATKPKLPKDIFPFLFTLLSFS